MVLFEREWTLAGVPIGPGGDGWPAGRAQPPARERRAAAAATP